MLNWLVQTDNSPSQFAQEIRPKGMVSHKNPFKRGIHSDMSGLRACNMKSWLQCEFFVSSKVISTKIAEHFLKLHNKNSSEISLIEPIMNRVYRYATLQGL
jgi:hypothetical protein